MKKHIQKCIMTVIVLLAFNTSSYAQQSLVDAQWQQRMQGLIPGLTKEWTEALKEMNPSVTRSMGQPLEDLSNVTYTPTATFILDYASYQRLTPESNLAFLIKLDTTRIEYLVFNKRENKYVGLTYGAFMNGRWSAAGFGSLFPHIGDIKAKLNAKNIFVSILRVSMDEKNGRERGYYIFIENGQLMCFRGDIPEPKPLLETLLKYKEWQKLGLE